MKKALYYLSPFILVPFSAFIMEACDNMKIVKMSAVWFFGIYIILSAIIGNLTPTKMKFDYIMTALMPLSLFCTMFAAGLLHREDLGSRFHFDKAFETALQPILLVLYLFMGLVVLGTSFYKIRLVDFLKRRKA